MRRSTRRSPPTTASSSSARTSRSRAACSRSRPGLYEKYGAERVFDTPISELALAGAAFGSAVNGLRPVVEIMFGDFLTLVMDRLVNQMSKYWFLTQEEVSVPVTIRSVVGAGGRFGAIHSQMPVSWLTGIPGIKIVAPSTPADAKALLRAAIDDDNPVLFLEHKRLYTVEGEVNGAAAPLGEAAVVRAGGDVTIVSAMRGVHESLAAAERLAETGIDAEVVDLRTIRPLDAETILGSIAKTNRLVVVEEGPADRRLGRRGRWRSRSSAGSSDLDDAWRIATPDTPDPLQSPARGRAPPGRGPHRLRDRADASDDHATQHEPAAHRREPARAAREGRPDACARSHGASASPPA